jgi:tRNA modification GTPase
LHAKILVHTRVRSLVSSIQSHLTTSLKGSLLQTGIRTVLLGPPNAGKSSLLNLLAQRPASIVSAEPGTTRDVVEVLLDISGFPCVVGDTAGLREGDNVGAVEVEGVRRAKRRAEESDLRILVVDLTSGVDESLREVKPYLTTSTTSTDTTTSTNTSPSSNTTTTSSTADSDVLTVLVLNKLDLHPSPPSNLITLYSSATALPPHHIFPISCLITQGLESFAQGMSTLLQSMTLSQENILATNERQRKLLYECRENLNTFLALGMRDIVMGAEELKYASNALGKISGRVDPEEILGPLLSLSISTLSPPCPCSYFWLLPVFSVLFFLSGVLCS